MCVSVVDTDRERESKDVVQVSGDYLLVLARLSLGDFR
jgi:hypothetical protein